LLHANKADDSEVKREFRYLSITLLGSDNEKAEQPNWWQDNYFCHQKSEILEVWE